MTAQLLWRLALPTVMRILEYRVAWFFHSLGNVAGPLISLMVWLTVSEQGVRLPYDRAQFVTYYLLFAVVSLLTSSIAEWSIASDIRLGKISPWLLRPAPPILFYVGDYLGGKLATLALQLPAIAVCMVLFRDAIHLPTVPQMWLVFLLSLPLAAAVSFLLSFLTACLAFWIQDVTGILVVKETATGFLTGQVVPLALFPSLVGVLARIQPFRYTVSFPVEILAGRMSPPELASGFALQVGWCVVLWGCYRLVWSKGLRRYSATGA